MDVMSWMTQRLAEERVNRVQQNLSADDGPVAKTLVSMTLRQQVFLDMSVDDKIEWLERKILHRAHKNVSQEWQKVNDDTTKEGALNVKNVIEYTKKLVQSVKQRMRVLYAAVKKEFSKLEPDVVDLVPYPGDQYDPKENEFEVDLGLDDDGEENPHDEIWGYLADARKGLCDAKLIGVYGAPGIQWPRLVDVKDSLDAYPAQLRTLIEKLDRELDKARAKAAAKKKKKEAEKERERLAKLRVKVTLIATALAEYDYDKTPLYLSPGWHNYPSPDPKTPLKECWRVCGADGQGKVEFDDVPLGKQDCCIFTSNTDKDTLLKNSAKESLVEVVVRVKLTLVEADVAAGKVIDITPLLLHLPGFQKVADADGDDKANGEDDEPVEVDDTGEGALSSSSPEVPSDSDDAREKDDQFTVDDSGVKRGAPGVQKQFTRTHSHEIDCSKPFPIDPHNLTQSQVSMQLESRIRFLNGDAHEVLSSSSDVMFAGRESTKRVLHPSAHKIEDVDCLFADTPFGWFENLHHDVAWSKAYWQRLCVSAFGALHPNGVFVIRYGGWYTTDIYTSLIDAGSLYR